MDGFHYVDLFESNGLEYLLIIAMLLLFIPFWLALKTPARQAARASVDLEPSLETLFRLPKGYFFHRGHSWAQPEEDGLVRVGMDDFARKLVGGVQSVGLPAAGTTVTQGDRSWTLQVDSAELPMASPVDGEVVEINERILGNPGRIAEDPYGDSWLMKVKVPRQKANLNNLLSGDLARSWLDDDCERLKGLARDPSLGLVMQDGGMPVDGMARAVDPRRWEEIARSFFLVP